MLFYVGYMGFWNEGERDGKGIKYKDILILIIKMFVEKGCKVYLGCWRVNNL